MRQIQGSLFWIPYFHAKPCFGRLKQPKFLKCLIWRGEGSRLPVRGLQGLLEWGERGAVRSFTKWRQKCWLRRAAMSAPVKSFHLSWQRMTSIDTSTRGKDTPELLEVDQPTPRELNLFLNGLKSPIGWSCWCQTKARGRLTTLVTSRLDQFRYTKKCSWHVILQVFCFENLWVISLHSLPFLPAFWADTAPFSNGPQPALHPKLQRYNDTVKCAELSAKVPGHRRIALLFILPELSCPGPLGLYDTPYLIALSLCEL